MSLGGGSSKGSSSETSTVDVPEWLQPFLNQSVSAAGSALTSLRNQSGGDVVADLNPDQLAALQRMRDVAGGEGGFFPTAQDTFLNTAQGVGTGFLDPALRDRLGGDFDLTSFINEARGATDFTQTPEARDALTSTARGDFLFGGEGFDAAVDAAVRSAQPHILSTFGRAGAGGSTSGLAQTAIGQSAIDAFASQFGSERARQLGAANALESGGRADRSQFLGLGESGANRAQRGDQFLAGLSDAERNRQLAAAGALPDIGMLDSAALMGVGDILQGQEQREISGPMQAQLQLLMAALGGLPISNLLGNTTEGDFNQTRFGFTGLEL